MSYYLLEIGKNRIDYHVSTFGKETIKLNGKTVLEGRLGNNLEPNTYTINVEKEKGIITAKVISKNNGNRRVLDLYQDDTLIQNNIQLKWGKFKNKFKIDGLAKLEAYDIADAIGLFHQALVIMPYDAEIYFHLACAYSIQENTEDGIECLKLAIKNGFEDNSLIQKHDKLAFLRMQEAFKSLLFM